VPTTPDFAVVNCEPTVRFAFVIFASFYFILLPTFVDNSIVADTTDIINPFRAFSL
jgi:hypothetical protein